MPRPRVTVLLDDYGGAALASADWSAVQAVANLTVFGDHLADQDALAARLEPFEALCVMRERTAFPASLLGRLPRLRLIASTGPVNATVDTGATERPGITVVHTAYDSTPTIELAWALVMASQRRLVEEATSLRPGG